MQPGESFQHVTRHDCGNVGCGECVMETLEVSHSVPSAAAFVGWQPYVWMIKNVDVVSVTVSASISCRLSRGLTSVCCVQCVLVPYQETLDAYVQLVIANTGQAAGCQALLAHEQIRSSCTFAGTINQLQLILLAAEGVLVCALSVGIMLFVLRGVAKQRFSLFSVFMVIPTSLVRRLAVSFCCEAQDS